jgi:hypothetical protein
MPPEPKLQYGVNRLLSGDPPGPQLTPAYNQTQQLHQPPASTNERPSLGCIAETPPEHDAALTEAPYLSAIEGNDQPAGPEEIEQVNEEVNSYNQGQDELPGEAEADEAAAAVSSSDASTLPSDVPGDHKEPLAKDSAIEKRNDAASEIEQVNEEVNSYHQGQGELPGAAEADEAAAAVPASDASTLSSDFPGDHEEPLAKDSAIEKRKDAASGETSIGNGSKEQAKGKQNTENVSTETGGIKEGESISQGDPVSDDESEKSHSSACDGDSGKTNEVGTLPCHKISGEGKRCALSLLCLPDSKPFLSFTS